MADDLGGGQRPELERFLRREAAREAVEIAGGEQVARARGVHHLLHREGRHGDEIAARHRQRALLAACDDRALHILPQLRQRRLEIGLVQRGQLSLIGEDQVDHALAHQLEEFRPVAKDAEGIGQGERHGAAGLMGDVGRLEEGLLCRRRIPEIAFQIGHACARHRSRVDIGRREVLRRAEIGVHGALAIRRHQDEAARRGRPVIRGRGGVGDAGGADVMGEDAAQLVVAHLADEARAAAQRGDADHGVGGRTAGNLHAGAHVAIDRPGARLVDERHAALRHGVPVEKGFLGTGDHVDDGIAEADHIELLGGHGSAFLRDRSPAAGKVWR